MLLGLDTVCSILHPSSGHVEAYENQLRSLKPRQAWSFRDTIQEQGLKLDRHFRALCEMLSGLDTACSILHPPQVMSKHMEIRVEV